jgi:hypothetical protein
MPLFRPTTSCGHLNLIAINAYQNGVVQLRYGGAKD